MSNTQIQKILIQNTQIHKYSIRRSARKTQHVVYFWKEDCSRIWKIIFPSVKRTSTKYTNTNFTVSGYIYIWHIWHTLLLVNCSIDKFHNLTVQAMSLRLNRLNRLLHCPTKVYSILIWLTDIHIYISKTTELTIKREILNLASENFRSANLEAKQSLESWFLLPPLTPSSLNL